VNSAAEEIKYNLKHLREAILSILNAAEEKGAVAYSRTAQDLKRSERGKLILTKKIARNIHFF
jgi:hypothetical protein